MEIQFVFSISSSIALLNRAQFNCQFLCVSKVLPSSILALSWDKLYLFISIKNSIFLICAVRSLFLDPLTYIYILLGIEARIAVVVFSFPVYFILKSQCACVCVCVCVVFVAINIISWETLLLPRTQPQTFHFLPKIRSRSFTKFYLHSSGVLFVCKEGVDHCWKLLNGAAHTYKNKQYFAFSWVLFGSWSCWFFVRLPFDNGDYGSGMAEPRACLPRMSGQKEQWTW